MVLFLSLISYVFLKQRSEKVQKQSEFLQVAKSHDNVCRGKAPQTK